jgi:L-gulonolactone oxidase
MRVPGLWVEVEDQRYDDLDAFHRLADEGREDWPYDVAWIDCMAAGGKLGRGVFTRSRHVARPVGGKAHSVRTPRLTLPIELPEFAMNRFTIGAFNALLWHKAPAKPQRRLVHFDPVFYPLDAIAHWNRLYGRRGFYQFQCVIPTATAQPAVRALLQSIAAGGEGSFLGVLKTFGERPSPGLLSFPMPGTTLALDFPNRGARTLKLLDRLHAITREAGGRLYPAKDGCMSADDFQRGYPRWREYEPHIDPQCSSSFWRRVGT